MFDRLQFLLGLIALGALALLAGCQSAPALPSANAAAQPEAAQVRENIPYQLDAGDRLRVTVFGEPDLSGEFVVDGAGYVSLPLIEGIRVDGLTVREFQDLAETRFADGFLRQPRVSAEVLNYRPYYILGEVGKPGEYPYSNGLTILNAIATAEGFTYRANKKVVLIKSADRNEEIRVELTPGTRVQPGDTIRVLERFF